MKTWILVVLASVVVLVGAFAITKKVSPVSWKMWGNYNASSGVAMKGYDPVAYFNSSRPVTGSSQFTVNWGGVRWQFATADNKEAFSKSPEMYAPQFGGYCSFAVGKGFTADISPEAWYIKDNKLYLFADKDFEKRWIADIAQGSLSASKENWAKR